MKARYSLAAAALVLGAIAGGWWLANGNHTAAEPPAAMRIEAFTAESYGEYLDAMVGFKQGERPAAPDPSAFLHNFTLVSAADPAERVQNEPESWWGSVATYALEGDPIPSRWIIRTTLADDLEGILVLSDTDTPL